MADSFSELGTTIRIIHRNIVKNRNVPIFIIACFNSKGNLKGKPIQMYKWCCYLTIRKLTKV